MQIDYYLVGLQVKMDFQSKASYKEGDEETLEVQLWEKIAEAGVLMAPGWYFSAQELTDAGEGHYRFSFSNAEVSTRPHRFLLLLSFWSVWTPG